MAAGLGTIDLLTILLDAIAVFVCLWLFQMMGSYEEAVHRTRRAETACSRIMKEKAEYKRQAREGNQRADLVLKEKKDLEDEIEKLHLAREVLRLKSDLRDGMQNLKNDVIARKIPAEEMRGYTITLTNFGTIAGRYATPVIIPPTVAILGAGRIESRPVARDGEIVAHRLLPLSLTFDHRAVTGGEAGRSLPPCSDTRC